MKMKIGLFPLSAKPFHAGHFDVIRRAAAENHEVFVFVSTSDRKKKNEFHVLGATMEDAWENIICRVMPRNVHITYGGSPIRKVYEYLAAASEEPDRGDTYTVYSDTHDIAKNFPIHSQIRYFKYLAFNNLVKFVGLERGVDTPDCSGTKMRGYLKARDFESFSKYVPGGMDAEKYWNILING
jgi:cytidyltransferase-like protein